MMNKWVITLVSIGLLSACASRPQPVGLSVNSEYQQVLVGSDAISHQVKITDIATEPMNGHIRGVVKVKNATLNSIQMQYRFYWYDKQGVDVNGKSRSWKQLLLHGGDEVSLSEVSLSPRGENFRLQIRELK